MYFEHLPPFTKMIVGALLGAILGIVFGLALGSLIIWIVNGLQTWGPDAPPYAVGQFLGMGAGAVIGSLLGGFSANKK